jgi:O-antigen/teichoic acid export membrane protein
MNTNKQLMINMIAQILGFLINIVISFFLTPFIVNHLGSEAYGYLNLGNNFINYISILTVALNSMAGRFITIKIHQADQIGASKYFSSIVFANIVMAVLLIFPSSFFLLNLEKVFHISVKILFDVKLLWAFIILNFLISLISSTFGVATFVRNKLYLSSISGIIGQLIRVAILLILFIGFEPSIWYMGLAAFLCTLSIFLFNIYYTKQLLPEIRVKRKNIDVHSIFEIVSSSIWNSLTRLSQILTSELDLLIANLFINSAAMGILAVAQTIPMAIISLIGTVSVVFSPLMTISYAKGEIKDLEKQINQSIKIMTIFSVIPNLILVCFGEAFYALWVPKENTHMIYILSVLTVINSVVTGAINPLYNIFTITNKVKQISKVMIIYGLMIIISTFGALEFTKLGIYAIAGVSTVFSFALSFIFHIPFAARCLNLPWYTFYRGALKSLLSFGILLLVGAFLNEIIEIKSWIILITVISAFSAISFVALFFILLNSNERKVLIGKLPKLGEGS